MKVNDLKNIPEFTLLAKGDDNRTIKDIYCCDLLSVAMGNCPADSALITVIGNVNALAVASLVDASCLILSEGVEANDGFIEKANTENIALFKTELSSFHAGLAIHNLHSL